MFIELMDILRCVRPHEDGWLVLSADRMSGRHVVAGTLGCPACGAQYAITDGEALLLESGAGGPVLAADDPSVPWLDDADAPLQLAALLALADVRQPVLLAGEWAGLGAPLAELVPGLYLALNPARPIPPDRSELSVIRAAGALPLAAGRLHGAALDAAAVTSAGLLEGAARAVRQGGRLIAPAWAPLPAHYAELGRDDLLWVAERRAAAGAPVPIARAPRAV